jgi:hypothetical protein
MGMKETWRLSLIRDEPWKLFDVVADATEHFSQAILQLSSASRGCQEACGHLLPAFKTLGRFMTAKLKDEPPTDLTETMAYLKRAESGFELAAPELGMINSFQIREARMMTKRLEEISTSGTESCLLLETYQRALFLMGRVLTRAALTEASPLEFVKTWNESMNMIVEEPGKLKPRGNEDLVQTLSRDDESLYARELIQEYEELREKRTESRSPVIRPVEEVLNTQDVPSAERAFETSEVLAYPEEWAGTPGSEAVGEVETKPTTPIETPDLLESGDDLPISEGCGDFAFAEEHRRPLLKSAAKFVSSLAEDLGNLAPRRAEFKTHRLQRQSRKAVLQFVVLRSFRLFAALVLLYLIVDLTHYFI